MNYYDYFGHRHDTEGETVRSMSQALADGEFSLAYQDRLVQFELEEAEARRRAKVAAKAVKKNPWLAELSAAPRRRKPGAAQNAG